VGDVESTWATRELPILRAALRRLDAGEDSASLEEIRQETGLPSKQLWAAVRALEDADPPYIEVSWASGWTDEHAGGSDISAVSERARRELGSWPSAEPVVSQLAAALSEAADREPEPERKTRLREVAEGLGGAARQIAVEVIAARLGRLDP
jgi:hypothetical protein